MAMPLLRFTHGASVVISQRLKKMPGPPRPAGYTREAKRKIIVSEEDAFLAFMQRDEAQKKLQDKLRNIANDQRSVFQPQKK